MIYLILDTNIWIYLANGHDPIQNKNTGTLHFELLSSLKKLVEEREIKILINEVILKEWERNKALCSQRIEVLKKKLQSPDTLIGEIKKYAPSLMESVINQITTEIKLDIEKNELHVHAVKAFIREYCETIPVSQETINQAYSLAIDKKPPFHNGKNNIGDAVIFLSVVEYMKINKSVFHTTGFFVSNNIAEFTDGRDTDQFHPDLKGMLEDIDLEYHRILPSALNVSKRVVEDVKHFFEVFGQPAAASFTWDFQQQSDGVFMYLDIPYFIESKSDFSYLTIAVGKKEQEHRPIRMTFIIQDAVDINKHLTLMFWQKKADFDEFIFNRKPEQSFRTEYQHQDGGIFYASLPNGYAGGVENDKNTDVFQAFLTNVQLMIMYFRTDGTFQTVVAPLFSFQEQYKQMP